MVLAAALVFALLGTRGGRQVLLDLAVEQARDRLPGRLEIGGIQWPSLTRLEITDLTWTTGPDTLLDLRSAAVTFKPAALSRGALRLVSLAADVRSADAVALGRVFADSSTDAAGDAPPARLPDLACDSLQIEVQRLRLPSVGWLERIGMTGSFALARDGSATRARGRIDVGPTPWFEALHAVVGLAGTRFDLRAALVAREITLGLGAQGRIDATAPPALALAPLRLERRVPDPQAQRTLPADPTLAVDSTGALIARDLRIEGEAGRWTIDGRVERSGHGQVTLRAEWDELPPLVSDSLLARLLPAAEVRAEVRSAWRRYGPFGLDATIALGDSTSPWTATADLRLPGPDALAALLPPQAALLGPGPLVARATCAERIGPAGREWHVTLDLGATPWLDEGMLAAVLRPGALICDSLRLAAGGIALRAQGRVDDRRLEASGTLTVVRPDSAGGPAAGSDLQLTARVTGSLDAPEVAAGLTGRLQHGPWAVPEVEARILWQHDTLDLQWSAAGPVVVDPIRLDGCSGSLQAQIEEGAIRDITIDAFELRTSAGDLRTQGPARLRLPPPAAGRGLESIDFELVGSLDRLGIAGLRAGPFTLALHAPRPDSLRLSLAVDSVDIGARPASRLIGTFVAAGGTLAGQVELRDAAGLWVEASAEVPLDVTLLPPLARWSDAPARLDVTLTGVPLPVEAAAGHRPARLSGHGSLRGTLRHPEAEFAGEIELPGPAGPDYRLRLDARTADDATQARVNLELLQGDAPICTGHLLLPVDAGGDPPRTWHLSRVRPLEGALAAQSVDLARFQSLLPAGLDLQGKIDLQLEVNGPAEDPALDGTLVLSGGQALMHGGSQIVGAGRLAFAGSLRRPQVEGEVQIESGRLQLPEPAEQLHPTTGQALLWDLEPAAQDSSAAISAAEARAEADTARASGIVPDVRVGIRAPGRVWVRGRGLEVELAGDLTATFAGDHVQLSGDLTALRGDLLFLGRRFTVEEGRIAFHGPPEDPDLDITLTMQQAQQLFRVHLRGSATDPQLSLSSDPEMPEGDIVAHLVFGRPLDQLDTHQTDYLSQSALAAGRQSLADRIGGRLAREIGVDQLGIRDSRGGSGQSLVIGKYLNRRTLIRYAHALDTVSGFAVDLEYWLTQELEVTTRVDNDDASGIELNWRREY